MVESACPICGKTFRSIPRRADMRPGLRMPGVISLQYSAEGHELCLDELDRLAAEKRAEEDRRAAEEEEAYRKAQEEEKSRRRRESSGIPAELLERRTFLTFLPDKHSQRAFDALRSWEMGPGYLIHGPPGTGKTHLLISLAGQLLQRGTAVRFENLNRLLGTLRSLVSQNEHLRFEEDVCRLETVPALLLDDLGAEKLTEWAEAVLERILSVRYDLERPTFFSSNLTESGLAAVFSARTASRIAGLVREAIVVSGVDKRKPTTGRSPTR